MSVSTRTVQQPLGIGKLGAALAVVALALIAAGAIALGSVGAPQAKVAPAAGVANPAAVDHQLRDQISESAQSKGMVPPDARPNQGTSQAKASTPLVVSGWNGDTGLAPRLNASDGVSSTVGVPPDARPHNVTTFPHRANTKGKLPSISAGRRMIPD